MEKKVKILAFFALFLLLIPVFPANASLTGWQYRRAVTIDNTQNTNALTDYQVKIVVDTASLISAGKMKSDGSDIRFTDSDGTTLLSYWIESGINTASTVIWVKIPSIPASSTKTIYMYYGNPSATAASDGSATFAFFDDFLGTSLDTTKWYVVSGTSYTVSNGVLKITVGAIGLQYALPFNLNSGYITEARVQYNTNSEGNYGGVLEVSSSRFTATINANADATILYMANYPASSTSVVTSIGNGASASFNVASAVSVFTMALNTWYILGDETTPSTAAVWKDYSRLNSYSVTWSKNINYIALGAFYESGTYDIKDTSYDWVRVRKYIPPEPTATVSTTEEIPNQPPSVSISSVTPSSVYRGSSVNISGSYGDKDGYVTGVYVNITDSSGALVITNGLANLSNPSGNGTWSYTFSTTASSKTGSYSISVKAVDNASAYATASLSNAFSVLNNPPVIQDKGVDPAVQQINKLVKIWVKATDFETSTLTASATITKPDNTQTTISLAYNSTSGRYENTFNATLVGSYSVSYTVTDADGASATASASFTATAGPAIYSVSAKPSNTTRPANITITAYISDPDTPDSGLTVYAKVAGVAKQMKPNGTLHYFSTWFYFDTSASIGYYDVYINATDGAYPTAKTFTNVFSIYNVKPSVSSITAYPSNATLGTKIKLSVVATDPDSPIGSLTVTVKVTDPSNQIYSLSAPWDGSYYTAYFSTSSAMPTGKYEAEAIARDPNGAEGGPALCYFYLNKVPPNITYIKVSKIENYVNSSVFIAVLPSEAGIDPSTFTCDIYVSIPEDGEAKLKGLWNGIEFVSAFNPLKKGYYSVRAVCMDPAGLSAEKELKNAFYAVPLPAQTPLMQNITEKKGFLFANFTFPFLDQLSSLLSPITNAIKTLIANTELFMVSILIIGVLILLSSSKKRRRR